MKFEDLLMQPSDEKQKRVDLQDEVIHNSVLFGSSLFLCFPIIGNFACEV